MDIKIEGLRELRADIASARKNAEAGAMKGMQEAGLEIVAEAKKNLNQNKTNNTGTLRASGKVQKDKDGVDAGFFAEGSSEGYASFVEYGRGPTKQAGQIPLRTTLKAWVHRKLGIPYGKELESATFLIARKIHRKGTKAQPFFNPAVKKFEDKVSEIVSKYVDNSLK
jgi:HK97 gp10 family phage protein